MTEENITTQTPQNPSEKEDGEWFIAINTMPVEHDRIVNGLLDKLGITEENGFMFSLIKSLSSIIPDEMYDKISTALFGGEANHSYISVCEMVDGKPVTREILYAAGIEYDESGQPYISSKGELTPMVYDKKNFDKDPMSPRYLNETENIIKIVEGGKGEIDQAYRKMLHAANQIAKTHSDYDFTGKNCNVFTAEALEAIGEDLPDIKGLAAGITNRDLFHLNELSTNEEMPPTIGELKNQLNPDFLKVDETTLTHAPQSQNTLGS